MSEPKEILIRNKLREAQGEMNSRRHEGYQSEHERIGRTPIFAEPQHGARLAAEEKRKLVEDFTYAKKRPINVDSSEGKKAEERRIGEQQVPPTFRPQQAIASGHNEEELSWIPRPIISHREDPNLAVIGYDDVSFPHEEEQLFPPPQFKRPIPELEQESESKLDPEDYQLSIDDITEGNYFVVVKDRIMGEAPELELIESFVEETVFSNDNHIRLEDIVVLRKMKIKVGIGVS